jgi:hypothetical protein
LIIEDKVLVRVVVIKLQVEPIFELRRVSSFVDGVVSQLSPVILIVFEVNTAHLVLSNIQSDIGGGWY